jgi:hypothetical protein
MHVVHSIKFEYAYPRCCLALKELILDDPNNIK